MAMNCPKKLDFNAPLFSTKRPGGFTRKEMMMNHGNSMCVSGNANEMVPFSWEVAPGKPKELQKCETIIDEDIVLPPKPPPNRWHLSKEATTSDDDDDDDDDDDPDQDSYKNHGHDDSCNGDVDDDDDDVLSDAMDVLSLSEAIDMIEKAERAHEVVHGLSSVMVESLGEQSPNFMIQRFLPDANALAASSSALAVSTQFPFSTSFPEDYYVESQTGGGRSSYSSSTMGCGLQTLFPWRTRIRPKPCSIKSPVRKCMADSKPQSSARRKQNSTFVAQFRE